MHKHFQQKTSPVEQLQRFFSANIFLLLDFPKGFYSIKGGNLTIKCLNSLFLTTTQKIEQLAIHPHVLLFGQQGRFLTNKL